MIKTKNLDELQLLKRGNIFKHGLFILVSLLLLNTLLYSYGIEWTTGKWGELTIILITIVICAIEFIYHDIYPLTENKQKYLIYISGLYGLTAIVICIYDMISKKTGIIVDGKVTSNTLGIIYGVLFIAVFVTYKFKVKNNSCHENDE